MADRMFLLDSDVCIYLLKNLSPVLAQRVADQPAETLFMSAITLAEISIGFGVQAAASPELAALTAAIPVVPFDGRAAEIYASLPFRCGSFDRLIAAQAIARDMILITNNEADFSAMPDLRIENWTLQS